LQVRIGIHLGDVVRRGDDIVGDGVNIAARVEPLAESGGIAITQQVFDQVYNKIPETLASIGKVKLKNIQRQVEVYRIILGNPCDHGRIEVAAGRSLRPAIPSFAG
jgi:adenylate cyclase